MPKYEIKSPVQHDGERYEIGDEIDLGAKEAKQLLDLGAIAPSSKTASSSTSPNEPTDSAERLAKIKDAIGKLDKDAKAAWTKDGRPDLAALSDLLGWRVTGAERDQAWADLKPQA